MNSAVKGKEGTLDIAITQEYNETEINIKRTEGKNGADFEISGKSVEVYDGEKDDGAAFEATLKNVRVANINNVYVLVGNFDVTVTPIYDGEEEDDEEVKVKLNLEDDGKYIVYANVEFGKYEYTLNIESALSSGTDFGKFETPDKKALTDFDEFIESMEDKFEDVAEDVLEDVDPDLLLQISKKAQKRECEAREKLIEENLVKYIKTGNGGKAFTDVNDVIAKQKAFDKMFDEGHPPYCTCGGNTNGSKYEIYVYKDLSYSIKCRNSKCPNYGN